MSSSARKEQAMDHSTPSENVSSPQAPPEMLQDVRKCSSRADFVSAGSNDSSDHDDPQAAPSAIEDELTDQQRAALELLVQGSSVSRVAQQLGVHRMTVSRWRSGHA